MITNIQDRNELKLQFERAAHDPTFLGALMMGKDVVLYKHQVSAIRDMGPLIYEDQVANVALMGPTQSGITTTMLIMAVHHAVFSPQKTALFLLKDKQAVSDFKIRLNQYIKQLRWTIGVQYSSFEECPGRLEIKTSNLTNVKALKRSENIVGVFIDSPPQEQDSDFIKTILATTLSMKSRIHIFSAGYHQVISEIIRTGNLAGVKFNGYSVNPRDMFSIEVLDNLYMTLGETEFLRQIVCVDPRDPNALARFVNAGM